jgi:hypothetical protein
MMISDPTATAIANANRSASPWPTNASSQGGLERLGNEVAAADI